MSLGIVIVVLVLLLKSFSLLGGCAFTISKIVSFILAAYLVLSVIMDVFVNIPKTMTSTVHPNRPSGAEEPGELYKELWAQQKKRYPFFIGMSLLIRGLAIYLVYYWFI
ncbi:MAG: hypothetical protein JW725_00955 [Candidatus Babeliaceae bacterium]|nr:hypothetical protein [Candidatus Babeliaceae bacterium]